MANVLFDLAKNGEFLREYGQKYFCVIREALAIDRILVSLVPIGKGGKDAADFYLTTTQFMQLAEEIRRGVFAKKIAADKGNYPAAYKFVTGENGEKRLNIGGGQVGVRVQVIDNAHNYRYIMAVNMAAFDAMARNFELFTGLRPLAAGSYFEQFISLFNAGIQEREKFRGSLSKEDEVAASAAPEEGEEEKENTITFVLQVHGEPVDKKGFLLFPAKDGNRSVTLMFRKSDIGSLTWFDRFAETAASQEGIKQFKLSGQEKDNYILFTAVG